MFLLSSSLRGFVQQQLRRSLFKFPILGSSRFYYRIWVPCHPVSNKALYYGYDYFAQLSSEVRVNLL